MDVLHPPTLLHELDPTPAVDTARVRVARRGEATGGAGGSGHPGPVDAADITVVDAGPAAIEPVLAEVVRLVAPAWRLEDAVAVNPYLGLADRPMADALAELEHLAGWSATLPASHYLAAVDAGRVRPDDLAAALAAARSSRPGGDPVVDADVDALVAAVRSDAAHEAHEAIEAVSALAAGPRPATVGTAADVAARLTGADWDRIRTDRISAFLAAFTDEGQAMWRSVDRSSALYRAWRAEASVDRTPEILGLRGFRRLVRSLPDEPVAAIDDLVARLGVPAEALPTYLHALVRRVGGWAAFLAQPVWRLPERPLADDPVVGLLAGLLAWEVALAGHLRDRGAGEAWDDAVADLAGFAAAAAPGLDHPLGRRLVLADAFDRAVQREVLARLDPAARALPAPDPAAAARPRAQLAFCIDVRSEVVRRHLEAVAPDVDTLGFAGFFGLPIELLPVAHDHGVAQCPVLLDPAVVVGSEVAGDGPDRHATATATRRRRSSHVRRRSWKSFKMGAVSCFSFVGPVGLAYLPKLFTDGRGRTRPGIDPRTEGLGRLAEPGVRPTIDPIGSAPGIPADARVDLAEGLLRGMSLTDGFAPLVVLAGHRSSTVNNPFAGALDCGACGGHGGDANARVAAALLNDAGVRAGLAGRGIEIPTDTAFVAAVHDTTTDEVTLLDADLLPAGHEDGWARLVDDLAHAGDHARAERAARLGVAPGPDLHDAIRRRSRDWAQVRPEWGLAGCRVFVAAPRSRTRGADLGGAAFLHSYDWRRDQGFAVLETILTAPVVVASWISLQYYASTVEPDRLGAGNKVLHNVVGKVGVLEGNGGDLRIGLPWQSVHDGDRHQHEPVRLNVVVEAPLDALDGVLDAHPEVRCLFANGWLHLLAMDDHGRVAHRFGADGWEPVTEG